MKSLKYIRILLAAVMFLGITALLIDGLAWMLDDPNLIRHWLGWMPKIQFLPAILALNVVVIIAIVLVTILFGRIYCSVICPFGILQDFFSWLNRIIFRRKFHYQRPLHWLRYTVLGLFVALIVLGSFGIANGIASVIDPYSAFARMTTGFFASGLPLIVAIVTLAIIFVCSFLWGRLWCNTICPMGTLLGLFSKRPLFGIRIDREKCGGCHKCEHHCKANCINIDDKTVDNSRCVMCFSCLGHCKQGAIKFARNSRKSENIEIDPSRRKFLAVTAAVGTATVLHAQEEKAAAGMALVEDKAIPERKTPLKPAGAISLRNFESRCTACQLCVSKCPEHVLRPNTSLDGFMQPSMVFDQGFCRPACTRCSEVCPSGAIQHIDKKEKYNISIGYAVVLKQNCIGCGLCERHCPARAIQMVDGIPAVLEHKCIGCGKCEYYCPATPTKAIFVEGRNPHARILI